MSDTSPVVVWFRRDLRTADNPALFHASETGRPVVALYIRESDHPYPQGGAADWWLHYSLESLQDSLGIPLIIRRGKAVDIVPDVVRATGASALYINRRYTPRGHEIDKAVTDALDIEVHDYKSFLLVEPWDVKTGDGTFYKVFTPFWRKAREEALGDVGEPLPAAKPKRFRGNVESLTLADLDLLPTKPDWGSKMRQYWNIGERGAMDRLQEFVDDDIDRYADYRDRPDLAITSRLSPHLAHGEISPRQCWAEVEGSDKKADKFLSELGWREFSYNVLYHFPDLKTENYNEDFDNLEWETGKADLRAWQKGQTGYPFVDAGMRQLWETGWMHNRLRLVTASFLVKHLLHDWREGEEWFWDCLVGGDVANNAQNWQWVAGTGFDAAPFFRIFNPITQGEKFDPDGDFIRKWVPELKDLPNKYLHHPWTAPEEVLADANVILGKTYPHPIVEHKPARERALKAYKVSREVREE